VCGIAAQEVSPTHGVERGRVLRRIVELLGQSQGLLRVVERLGVPAGLVVDRGQQVAAPGQVERGVRGTTVGGAAPRRHQAGPAQQAQV
jgi:hypothetical protein